MGEKKNSNWLSDTPCLAYTSPGCPAPSHVRKMKTKTVEETERSPAPRKSVGEEEEERQGKKEGIFSGDGNIVEPKTLNTVSQESRSLNIVSQESRALNIVSQESRALNTVSQESRALNTITDVGTGRSHYHGGATRRRSGHGTVPLPPKVIVTANVKPGHLLDSTTLLDRNLPPPRLLDTLHPEHTVYQVNYPGAHLRVGATRPSHLSHAHGAAAAPTRREEPHSIDFGSHSLSMGAYHPPREPEVHNKRSHLIPREPVKYYNPVHPTLSPGATSPVAPPPRPNVQQPHPQGPQPRPQGHQPLPQGHQPLPQEQEPLLQSYQLRPQGPQPVPQGQEPLLQSYQLRPQGPQPLPQGQEPLLQGYQLRPHGLQLRPQGPNESSLGPQSQRPQFRPSKLLPPASRHTSVATSTTLPQPPPTIHPLRRLVRLGGYTRPDGSSYQFVAGEVYSPPPLQRTPYRHSQKPFVRITTRRPAGQELPLGPFQEDRSTITPKYVKETIAEMDYEPRTYETTQPPTCYDTNWFLMPVQGWFVLSIILAALVIILLVVCAILYSSFMKQRRKVKKLLSAGLVVPGCVDPVNHEVCQCRSVAPLVSSHTLLSSSSVVSRTSGRSLRLPSRYFGDINYSNDSQERTLEFGSLPTASVQDTEKDNNLDSITTMHTQLELEDGPPPLVPKKTSVTGITGSGGAGAAENKGGAREKRLGNPEGRNGRESRLGVQQARSAVYEEKNIYDGRNRNAYSDRSGGHGDNDNHHQRATGSRNLEVQLTTIYPPPRRFKL
nr:uncharacterized protein LOC128696587 [Cherax quadricarinatus]